VRLNPFYLLQLGARRRSMFRPVSVQSGARGKMRPLGALGRSSHRTIFSSLASVKSEGAQSRADSSWPAREKHVPHSDLPGPAADGAGVEHDFGDLRRPMIIFGLEIEPADDVIIQEIKATIGVGLDIEPTGVLIV
jgi:hypothetical protein